MPRLLVFLVCLVMLASCNGNQEISTGASSAVSEFLADSDKAAVIKFYASWCSSCKQYAPAFEQAKASLSNKADFYSVDVDESKNKALVRELRISRIPETVFVSQDRNSLQKVLGPIRVSRLSQLVGELVTD